MNKILVCYFSASGTTKKVADKISSVVNGDLFEIEPVDKYTNEDLDWTNKDSRSTIEMNDKSSRPAIVRKIANIDNYEKIVIGFPVWWQCHQFKELCKKLYSFYYVSSIIFKI